MNSETLVDILMDDLEPQFSQLFDATWFEFGQLTQMSLILDRAVDYIESDIKPHFDSAFVNKTLHHLIDQLKIRYLDESYKHKELLLDQSADRQFTQDLTDIDCRLTKLFINHTI